MLPILIRTLLEVKITSFSCRNLTMDQTDLSSTGSFDVVPISPYPVEDVEVFGDLSVRYSIRQQKLDKSESNYNLPYQTGSVLPNFIALRDHVLRFWTFFVDIVPGNTRDSVRHRKCELNFFLEGGTIEVCFLICWMSFDLIWCLNRWWKQWTQTQASLMGGLLDANSSQTQGEVFTLWMMWI